MARTKNQSKVIYSVYFGIPYSRMRHMSHHDLEQLENCESLEAMRLLLGISRKEKLCPTPNAKLESKN